MIKDKYIYDRNIELTFSKCRACLVKSHTVENCPKLHYLSDKSFIIQKYLYSTPCLERIPFNRRIRICKPTFQNRALLKREAIKFNFNFILQNAENENEESQLASLIESQRFDLCQESFDHEEDDWEKKDEGLWRKEIGRMDGREEDFGRREELMRKEEGGRRREEDEWRKEDIKREEEEGWEEGVGRKGRRDMSWRRDEDGAIGLRRSGHSRETFKDPLSENYERRGKKTFIHTRISERVGTGTEWKDKDKTDFQKLKSMKSIYYLKEDFIYRLVFFLKNFSKLNEKSAICFFLSFFFKMISNIFIKINIQQ